MSLDIFFFAPILLLLLPIVLFMAFSKRRGYVVCDGAHHLAGDVYVSMGVPATRLPAATPVGVASSYAPPSGPVATYPTAQPAFTGLPAAQAQPVAVATAVPAQPTFAGAASCVPPCMPPMPAAQRCYIMLADGRQLFVNRKGWCCAEHAGTYTNTDHRRRHWTLHSDGMIALADGRQLYVNHEGWCVAENAGMYTNTDRRRRHWSVQPGGVLALADGRQLYVNHEGWCGAVSNGTHTNTDHHRRHWIVQLA